MNTQIELKKVTIELDENQLMTLAGRFDIGCDDVNLENRADIKELYEILGNAIRQVVSA